MNDTVRTAQPRARLGLLAGYFVHFDDLMPASYRQEKEDLGREVAGILGHFADVVYPGLISNFEQGMMAGELFRQHNVDGIVAFPTMASPPGFAWNSLKDLDRPLLVWNGHLRRDVPDDFDMGELVRQSCNVGSVMLTNTLLRNGRHFSLVTGPYRDPAVIDEVRDFSRAAAAARALRRARIGRLGEIIPGYLDVSIDPGMLANTLGPQVVDIPSQELTAAFLEVDAPAVVAHRVKTEEEYDTGALSEAETNRSIQLAIALERLVTKHELMAGTVNCQSDMLQYNPEIGICACYAVSHQTGKGVPFTCTGDVPTAIAMLMVKLLGGEALYHELDMIDYNRDLMLLANCGEADAGLADSSSKKSLIPNRHFLGKCGYGGCVYMNCKKGPGTLVSFSPRADAKGGYVLVIAPGEILGTYHPAIRVPNALFRFKTGNTVTAYKQWCLGGATHHGAASSGDLTRPLVYLADMLSIQACVV